MRPETWGASQHLSLMALAQLEVEWARGEFPGSDMIAGALLEEAGEFWQEAMNAYNAKGRLHQLGDCGFMDAKRELVQVVAMCIRLWEEGDPAMHLPPLKNVGRKGEKE